MEAAKSAASTGKESVSDKTKISVFVTQRRVCRFSLLFYSFKRLHINKLLLKWMNSYVFMAL